MADGSTPTAGGRKPAHERFLSALVLALRASLKTIWFLAKVTVPITFAVAFLEWLGFLSVLARWLDPVMGLIGLPGKVSLALISSVFVNIYAAVAVIGELGLASDGRALTIMAVFCLLAHALPVETAVMKKTGSPFFKMVAVRLLIAVCAAFFLNAVLPRSSAAPPRDAEFRDLPAVAEPLASFLPDLSPYPEAWSAGAAAIIPGATLGLHSTVLDALASWAINTLKTMLTIALIVTLLMILQKLLDEFGLMRILAWPFKPIVWAFGLPKGSSMLWLLIQVVGYSYGAAVLMDQVEDGKLKGSDGDLLNHHAAACHSLLEDSAIFASLGVGLFWLVVPRLAIALALVWAERLRRFLFRRSFRVGTL